MLKQAWIAECDLCGETTNLPYDYTLPEGWEYGANKNCQFCPKCIESRFPQNEPVVPVPDSEFQEVLYG